MLDTSAWLAAYHQAWITLMLSRLLSCLQKTRYIILNRFDLRIGVAPRFGPIGNHLHRRKRILSYAGEPRLFQAIVWRSNGGR